MTWGQRRELPDPVPARAYLLEQLQRRLEAEGTLPSRVQLIVWVVREIVDDVGMARLLAQVNHPAQLQRLITPAITRCEPLLRSHQASLPSRD